MYKAEKLGKEVTEVIKAVKKLELSSFKKGSPMTDEEIKERFPDLYKLAKEDK